MFFKTSMSIRDNSDEIIRGPVRTRMRANESMSYRGRMKRMEIKESMSYSQPQSEENLTDQLRSLTKTEIVPQTTMDVMKVLKIEERLRQEPEYLNKTSEFIKNLDSPPIELDSEL